MAVFSRREFIIAGGSLVAGGGIGALAYAAGTGEFTGPTPSPSARGLTVADWVETRRAPYLIGHRGVGGVIPEHTMPSYLKAIEWGAQCIEISVVISSDRVLYCHRELTLNRTTSLKGEARQRDSSELDKARISVPRLGPRWMGTGMPPLPRLESVLDAVAGKAVICIEPRNDAAYPDLVQMIRQKGLTDSVIIKLHASSPRIRETQQAGFPVFAYLGNAKVTTPAAINSLASRLDATKDCLVIPARDEGELLKPEVVEAAVRTGVPTWVFPIHRRHEANYFSLLGVEGIVAADVGYQSGQLPILKTDMWSSGQLSSGELTRNPYANAFNLEWGEDGVVSLPTPNRQAFVTFGGFGPTAAESYRISFDVSFDPLPRDTWQPLSISFGHSDDRYYETRLGDANGYHALLRADGTLALYAHLEGEPEGQELTPVKRSKPLESRVWARMTLDVTPDVIRWSRDDGTTVEARDDRFRGGYFHIGSSATDGKLRLRALTVS